MGGDPNPEFVRSEFAAQLAAMPDVADRLLIAHIPDEHGRCRACSTPGTGTPQAAWPCTLHASASAARRVSDRR